MKLGWKNVALKEVAEIERDIIEPSAISDGTTYVGLENIETGGLFVNVRNVTSGELASTKFAFTDKHVLYGKLRPYLAKIARPTFNGVCSTDILPILPKSNLDRDYLTYFLRQPSMVELATSRSTGANLPRLSPKVLAEFSIPLPPIAQQKRIAAILDKADELRSLRRRALEQLDAIAQSTFLEMFGNPATNPKGWKIVTIRNLLESASYGTSEKAGTDGASPILRMSNITYSGEMDFTDLKYIDLQPDQKERYTVQKGDVLFNRTNSAELVGKSAIYRNSDRMAYAGYLVRLRVTKDNDPEFLAAFLNSRYTKRVLRGMCKSIIGMANINATEVQGIHIPQPPLSLQQEFARRVEAIEQLKTTHREAIAQLDALFASLQHRAFRGEL